MMATFFHADEVLQGAVRIEENGEALYRKLAEQSGDPKFKEVFKYLAEQEVKHRGIFLALLSKLGHSPLSESFPGEYYEYLKGFADEHIFTPGLVAMFSAKELKDPAEGIAIALKAEIDSILYYLELKSLVPQAERPVLDKIIEEERRHYVRLLRLKAA